MCESEHESDAKMVLLALEGVLDMVWYGDKDCVHICVYICTWEL